MILIFDGETSSNSMLLLTRRDFGFLDFYDKMGDFSEADLRVLFEMKLTIIMNIFKHTSFTFQ